MLPVLTKQSLPTNMPPHVRSGVRAIDQLIRELGGGKLDAGQNRLLSLLALASIDDERINDLLGLVEDPDAADRPLGELVYVVGFRPGEIYRLVKETILAVAQVHSIRQLADQLPAVTEDLLSRAQVHYLPCSACDETGWVQPLPTPEQAAAGEIPPPEKCKVCRGRGKVRKEADFDRQQLALSMAHLLPKSGAGIAIQQNIGTNGSSAAGSDPAPSDMFSRLMKATDRILHGPHASAATIEVEPTRAEAVAAAREDPPIIEGTVVSSSATPTPPEGAHDVAVAVDDPESHDRWRNGRAPVDRADMGDHL